MSKRKPTRPPDVVEPPPSKRRASSSAAVAAAETVSHSTEGVFVCYIVNGYCGYTNDVHKRLSDHTKKTSRGAKSLRSAKEMRCHVVVGPFLDKSAATSFEHWLKNGKTHKIKSGNRPRTKRLVQLLEPDSDWSAGRNHPPLRCMWIVPSDVDDKEDWLKREHGVVFPESTIHTHEFCASTKEMFDSVATHSRS